MASVKFERRSNGKIDKAESVESLFSETGAEAEFAYVKRGQIC